MGHIIDEHQRELQTLIAKAMRTFATKKTAQQDPDIHENIIDFLSLMDFLVHETHHTAEVDTQLTRHMMPAVDHIDQATCNQEIVSASIAHAAQQKTKNPHINAQELLYKELLKRWKPSKKTAVH
jgi:hypothetical protein